MEVHFDRAEEDGTRHITPFRDKLWDLFAEQAMHLPAYATAVDELVSRLTANQAGEASPRPGEPMPSFALPDEYGHIIRLDALLKKGPVAITFHRGHWCPGCRISAAALAEVQNEIRRVGSEVIAILPERQNLLSNSRHKRARRSRY